VVVIEMKRVRIATHRCRGPSVLFCHDLAKLHSVTDRNVLFRDTETLRLPVGVLVCCLPVDSTRQSLFSVVI
jgi:hypothetical protein